jgi:hypothetical protein
VQFHVTMTPEDLARAGLDALGKQWGGGRTSWRRRPA